MFHRIHPTSLMLCAALALVSISSGASSAQTRTVSVHSYDLDLATTAGQAKLQQRIQRAIGQVCGSSVGARMDDLMSYKTCEKAARASAMSQFDAMVTMARDGKVAAGQMQDVILR